MRTKYPRLKEIYQRKDTLIVLNFPSSIEYYDGLDVPGVILPSFFLLKNNSVYWQ